VRPQTLNYRDLGGFLLTARRAVALGAALILIVASAAAGSIWYLRHDALAEAERTAEYAVHVVQEQADLAFGSVDRALEEAVREAQGVLARPDTDLQQAHKSLRSLSAPLRHVRAVAIFDAAGGGVVVDSRRYPPAPRSVADHEHFRVHQAARDTGLFIGPPVLDRADGEVSITVSRPVRSAAGDLMGVVSAAMEPKYFEEIFRAAPRHPDDAVTIQLRDGRLLARYPRPARVVGQTFAGGPVVESVSRGARSGTIIVTNRLDGIERTVSFRSLDRYPVVAVVALSKKQTLAHWRKAAPYIAGTASAIALVLAGLTLLLRHQARTNDAALAQLQVWIQGIETSPVAMLLTDATKPDNPVAYVNPAVEALTGYRPEEIVGKNCRMLQGPGTDPAARAALREAIAAGKAFNIDLLNYRKDGTSFWNRVNIEPIKDRTDRITHFIGRQRDVTSAHEARAAALKERQATAEALRRLEAAHRQIEQSEARFRDFAQSASDVFWESDSDLRVTVLSDYRAGGEPAMPYRRIIGRSLPDLALQVPPDAAHLVGTLQEALTGRQAFKDVIVELTVGAGHRRFRISGRPFHNRLGGFLGYRGSARDISAEHGARKHAEAERARLAMAIETLHEGFALYDDKDNLVVCNAQYRKLNSDPEGSFILPGVSFESVVRRSVATGGFAAGHLSGEAWIAKRLEHHRNPNRSAPLVYHRADGHVYLITEQHLSDGMKSIVATDITGLERMRNRLQVAIDVLDAAFVLFDKDDRVGLCNRRYAEMMESLFPGRPPVGIAFDEILETAAATGALRPERPADQAGWPGNFREYHRRPDGNPFFLHTAGGRTLQVMSQLSELEGCVCNITDVTVLQQAQQALAESEERFRTLVESSPEAMVVVDESGGIEMVNEQAVELFGRTKAELLRLNVNDLVPMQHRGRHPGLVGAYMRDPSRRPMGLFREVAAARPDGSTVPVEVALNTMKLRGRAMAVAIVRDITDRKLAEETLRRSQRMEALGTLAGGIAHDLNNTLQPILILSSALRDVEGAGATWRKQLDDIETSTHRAKELVRQILAFSRGDASERETLSLCELVNELKGLLRASIPTMIALAFEPGKPALMVSVNRTAMHQIVMNLVKNAADAIGERKGTITIGVRLHRHAGNGRLGDLAPGRYGELSVGDTGAGMDQRTTDRIFDPFFTTKAVGEGTGLGLSIVHGIVKSHGGAVTVESAVGKGSTFRVYLPLVEQTTGGAARPGAEKAAAKKRN